MGRLHDDCREMDDLAAYNVKRSIKFYRPTGLLDIQKSDRTT